MNKKIVAVIAIVLYLTLAPKGVLAEQYGQGTYGQGTILGKGGATEIEHQPIEAGLKENLAASGMVMLATSFVLRKLARRESKLLI